MLFFLDQDNQKGDRETNVHVFEFHSTTAAWGLGFVLMVIGGFGLLWWLIRRRFAKMHKRRGNQLAILYKGCECGLHQTANAGRSGNDRANTSNSNSNSYTQTIVDQTKEFVFGGRS